MISLKRIHILLSLGLLASLSVFATGVDRDDATVADDVTVADGPSFAADSIAPKRHSLINRIIAYFDDSNKERKDKGFDISFIGGPHYSSEKKFGIGLLAAGVYYTDRSDSLTPPSNVSLYADVSTSGFYSVGVRGTTRFSHDCIRLNFDASFESMPDYFWGIGYHSGSQNSNKTSYKQLTSQAMVDILFKVTDGLYVGPLTEMTYIKGTTKVPDREWLWRGENMRTFSYCLGGKITYDTRDNLTAPRHGWYAMIAQRYYGKWMHNSYPFSSTEVLAAFYTPTWRDCVLATQYHMELTYGDTPWGMLPKMGGSYIMRGYYRGRYRDKGLMDLTVELRQRVYKRIGVVAWGGVGSIFSRFSRMNMHHLLPNYGAGVRWEFKRNVNVRLDMGFGKGEKGIVFSINEAF